ANAIQGYTDNCGSAVTASITDTLVTGTNCAWTVKYTFSVTDSCGNALTNQSYSNTGSDQSTFSIVCPAALSVKCASDVPTALPFTGTITNICSNNVDFDVDDVISNQTCANRYILTRTYTATDACNRVATCSRIITVFDDVQPSIICPANVFVKCASEVPVVDLTSVVTADGCGNAGVLVSHDQDIITPGSCINKFVINRTYRSTDVCNNTKTCVQVITVNDVDPPIAICKDITVVLDLTGNKIIRSNDINNGSGDNCGNNTITLFASDTAFNCSEIGINLITLTVYDLCNNSSTCVSTVTVREDIKPILFCPTLTDIQLKPGECGRFITFIEPYATDNCDLSPRVEQIDTTGLKSGDFFPGGIHCLKYRATDFSGNSTECTFCIELKLFNNPIKQLSCNDDVQISLDDSCKATVSADLILVGGPYSCYNDYIVQIKYASGGGLIDRDLNKAGTQIDYRDLGKQLIITVIDPRTGNSCWGKAFVEDKLPPVLICPKDTIIDCSSGTLPITTGQPYVYESCGQFNLSYVDQITNGSCLEGFEQIIHRTWIAIDNYGNKATCIQTITVKYADINQIVMPLDYNGYITPTGTHSLSCDEKYDEFFDLLKHLKPSTDCIDDYLLDNVEFIKTGRRIPKTLGWNIIKTGPYAGHPNTESIYYPVHKDSNQCWKSNEIIMWEGTGTPKVSGCANIGVSYTDIVITTSKAGCDAGSVGCYKLLRKWTILDWCTNKIRTYEQIIKVDDLEGPKILYPDTLDLPARANSCDAQWEVKNIWLTDNCSNEVHYTINVIYGTVLGNDHSGYVIIDIPFGEQYVTIVAEDCCGNVTEKRILLRVTDVTPPTAICQSKTVTSIVASSSPSENYSTIKVKSLDDGSFDNCANKVYFKAIRMDELQGTNNGSNIESNVCFNLNGDDNSKIVGSQSYFDDEVKFCCADVSSTKMVVFRVFDIDPGVGPVLPTRMNPGGDLFGHFSDCMIEVEVQNKSNPKLEAPADLVISCDYWFDVNRLIDPKDSLFGKMVNDLAWRKKVSTTDIVCESFCINNLLTKYPGGLAPSNSAPFIACDAYNKLFDSNHPDTKYNLVWGFDGYILSACGTNFTISIDDQRHCGQGKIIRTFSTTGQGGQSISVNQTIWVVDCDPFYINDNDACDTLDDIIWPDCSENGTIVSGCGANTSPDNIGRPIIVKGADDHCSLIAIVNTDQLFTTQTDACFVILRKWVVIDWCQYDPNISATKGRWEFSQYIKVRDVESPIVNCTMGDCEPASINSTSQICYGHINLKATAIDSCTPSELLSFEYKIDLYNDGTNDLQVGTLNTVEFNAGNKPQTTNNPNADNKNNPFDASGNYPIGVHKISWYITDGCGNVGTCSKLFEIKDCKAPTPYCLPGIVTVPMTTTKCVDIWAKDLNFASFDNCTPKENLKYYFNGDSKKTSIRICCEDFVKAGQNDELKINVEMWVEDQEGNKDFCNTVVIVQDNLDSCMNKKTLGKIVGSLAKEGGEEIKLASVQLELDSALMREVSASPYRFTDLELNKEYTVIPIRNDEPLNGVSTVDIVKLQKHILGKANIKSPYELIAADVNASGSITSADISEIRKLILGIIPQFAKVPSWTFVPESYVFPETNLPWNAPRKEKMNVTKEEEYKANFVAIKMGDLNGNANAGYQKAQVRTNGVLNLEIASNELKLGEIYKMEIKSSNFAGISGFQFTLNYDNQSLQFAGIESGVLNMKESNIGNFNNGILTTSWNSDNAESHKSDEVLYSILFKVNQSGTMSKLIALSSDITKAEAYNVQDQTLDVRLGSRKEEGLISTSLFELYQNEPNPFERECIINYRLPEASWAKLTIYDATGRILRIYELDGQKGLNTHKISRTELGNSSGLLYYQLDDAGHTATKRMMLIN
ncbi:MAG: HYR domain-containing protein, partial [Saprospiraceae bacterium]